MSFELRDLAKNEQDSHTILVDGLLKFVINWDGQRTRVKMDRTDAQAMLNALDSIPCWHRCACRPKPRNASAVKAACDRI
jgi:hypothetical protein